MSDLNKTARLETVTGTKSDNLQTALVVITTTETQEEAERLAHRLVEHQLAACVQLVAPLTSVYRWEGKVETTQEVLLLIKTTLAAYAALETEIKQRHSYQTPEIIALPVVAGAQDYLAWLRATVRPNQ